MKSDRTRRVAPKSTVDENSVSSISNGASSNSNGGATTGEDLSNGGSVVVSNSNSSVGGVAGISASLQPSSLIGSGAVALASLVLETAGITLGVPQPAHQASNIILTRAVSSGLHW